MSEEKKDKDGQDGGEKPDEVWGEVISSYSRKQAIEDGVLVDVSYLAVEEGFVYPVALTQTLFSGFITPDSVAKGRGESVLGRLHDMFTVLRASVAGAAADADTIFFETIFTRTGNPRRVRLKALVGPGDQGEPVITLMLPEED